MAEEIFDVVDEDDQIIGRNTRAEVHRLGLRHRAVHVLVYNSRGEVFLQKRSMTKDTFPGAWDSSAAGHVDCGEDYDACAIREMREELGLEADRPPRRLFRLTASADTGMEHVWVYRYASDGPFALNPEEIERGDWFEPERITQWLRERQQDFASAFVVIWKTLIATNPRPTPRPAHSPQ